MFVSRSIATDYAGVNLFPEVIIARSNDQSSIVIFHSIFRIYLSFQIFSNIRAAWRRDRRRKILQINRIFHNSISISFFFFIVFVLFFLEGIERIVERNIIIRCCTNFKSNSSTCVCFQREQCTQNSRAYSFLATFERVWVRLTRDRFPSTKTNIPGRSSMFFPQTTIERVGEMKNRMGRKRRTDKRRKDGGGRGRERETSETRETYTWGDLF